MIGFEIGETFSPQYNKPKLKNFKIYVRHSIDLTMQLQQQYTEYDLVKWPDKCKRVKYVLTYNEGIDVIIIKTTLIISNVNVTPKPEKKGIEVQMNIIIAAVQ